MTVVLAGCGALGHAVGSRFLSRGRRVLGLRRSSGRLPAGFDEQPVDLSRQVPVLPADTDVVVVALTADERTGAGYRATYLDGLRNVLEAVDRHCASPPRILFVSSTAVYGRTDGADRSDVIRFLADQMGVPVPRPADAPDAGGRGKRCRNDRLLADGLTLRYPTFREGYRAVLADLPEM